MPEVTMLLTDDHDRITHVITEDEEYITIQDLAKYVNDGKDYYVTFGDVKRFTIDMVAEDGYLEPTIDDPSGEHSIWDLPVEEDRAEEELEELYDEMRDSGEFDDEEFLEGRDKEDPLANL